jgi:hypothetical protein
MAARSTETDHEAALLIALSRYNTGRPLAGIANGYANQVIAAQSALSSTPAGQNLQNANPQWDVWGATGDGAASWVITTDVFSRIERAGAQTSDARSEGRAPASASEKGEPYVLSAFQESEPR